MTGLLRVLETLAGAIMLIGWVLMAAIIGVVAGALSLFLTPPRRTRRRRHEEGSEITRRGHGRGQRVASEGAPVRAAAHPVAERAAGPDGAVFPGEDGTVYLGSDPGIFKREVR